jgi:hypothetical protein
MTMPHTLNQHELVLSTDQFETLLLLLKDIDGAHKVSHEQLTLQIEKLHEKLDATLSASDKRHA